MIIKKILLFLLAFTLLLASLGAINTFTRSIDNRKTYKNSYNWTGRPKDLLLDWAQEVEDRLDGSTANQSFLFSEETSDPTATEGRLYYNTTSNILKLHTGSSFVNVSTGAGNSLDSAYDAGIAITVDAGAVALTGTDAANNTVFQIVQSDTGTALGLDLNNAGSGNSIDIQGSSGNDIQGTDDTWKVTTAGAFTTVGIANTGAMSTTADFTITGTSKNIKFDVSRNQLSFADDAVLGMGGADNAAGDVTFAWNGTNLLVESAAEDTGEIEIGATNAIDLVLHANTAASEVAFNASTATAEFNGYNLQMQDGDFLMFGDDDDWTIDSSTAKRLDIVPVTTDESSSIHIGASTAGGDLKMWGATASTFALWDASADELVVDLADLKISQGSQIEFIDVTDSLTDWTIDLSADETLLFLPSETDDTSKFNIGDATNTADVRIFGATASTVVFDASGDEVIFNAYDISLQDGDFLKFGDGDDFTIDSSTTKELDFAPAAASDDYIVNFGVDQSGVDIKAFGATASELLHWDASADSLTVVGDLSLFTMTGTTLPFHVNATGTVTGVAINFETTDGSILLNADGATWGDIELNSADNTLFTSAGDLTFAVTGTLTMGGSAVDNTLMTIEVEPGTAETVLAADSGRTFANTAAQGATTFTLPDAAAGLWYIFVDNSSTAADDVIIDPAIGDNIDHDTNGDAIESVTDAYPQTIMVIALNATDWATFGKIGTWGQQ